MPRPRKVDRISVYNYMLEYQKVHSVPASGDEIKAEFGIGRSAYDAIIADLRDNYHLIIQVGLKSNARKWWAIEQEVAVA